MSAIGTKRTCCSREPLDRQQNCNFRGRPQNAPSVAPILRPFDLSQRNLPLSGHSFCGLRGDTYLGDRRC